MSTQSSPKMTTPQRQTTLTDLLRFTIPSPDPKPAAKRPHPGTPGTPEPENQLTRQGLEEYIADIVHSHVQEALKPHLEMIARLEDIILQKDRRIELEAKLNAISTPGFLTTAEETGALTKDNIEQLSTSHNATLNKLDDLEQRSRSWNLRFSGIKDDTADTDKLVCDIAASIGVALDPTSIDWSHYTTKADPKRGRQLVVRLVRINDRIKILRARKELRKPDQKFASVYINEDLTRSRFSLLQALLGKKREHKILDACSYNGKVCYKTSEDSKTITVQDVFNFKLCELRSFL
jgi:hypothetical protein